MRIQPLLLTLALTCVVSPSEASEKATVCARYEAQYGWSKGYKVEATITSGTELNRATRTFDYDSLSKYVVIFWDQDEVTVIKMSWPYLGPIAQQGEDQRGVKWEVSKTTICY